jgi:hypothetical protein
VTTDQTVQRQLIHGGRAGSLAGCEEEVVALARQAGVPDNGQWIPDEAGVARLECEPVNDQR